MRLGVTVFLGETKIDHVDLVAALADTHEEIVGFDVAVNEVAGVYVFDSGDMSWSARRRTVLSVNLRLQKLNRSSREGPL